MAISFDDKTGLVAEETTVIRAAVAEVWKSALGSNLNTEPETPAGQLIDGMTALILSKDSDLLKLGNMFNPKVAVGPWQDALGKIYFLSRQLSQPTTVNCQCRGLYGTVIPYGAVVQDTNGYQYYNTIVQTIPEEGVVESTFRCSEYGPIEVSANTVTKIITVVPGWDSVNNEAAGVVGRDEESQADFEQRRIDSVAKNSHGLAESVEGAVGNLDGVIACHIEQNRGCDPIELLGVTIPCHSVYLSVYGGEPEDIGMAMHKKLDAGCGTTGNTKVTIIDDTTGTEQAYYYETPSTKDVYVQVVLQRTSDTPANIEEIVKEAVVDNFNGLTDSYGRAKMGSTIYASRFYQTLFENDVYDIISVQVKYEDDYTDKVEIPLDVMPTLISDDVDVVVRED